MLLSIRKVSDAKGYANKECKKKIDELNIEIRKNLYKQAKIGKYIK